MSLSRSKVVTLSPRASATVRALANPPKEYIYYKKSENGGRVKNNRQNYTERRAKTPGVYKPLQHDSRPTTPHDHHHPWKPHKSTVIELPEYLLTTGDENKHIDARTLKPPPSPQIPIHDRSQQKRIRKAVDKLRETYEHRTSGFYQTFRNWDTGGRSGAKQGGVDAEEMLLQMELHGINWLNENDCKEIIKHYKHDVNNEPDKLHFKDWLHMCCKHAAEFSNWDSEYNPFKEHQRIGYKSPRLRKEKKQRQLQNTNPWRVKHRQSLSRPNTASSIRSISSRSSSNNNKKNRLLHGSNTFASPIRPNTARSRISNISERSSDSIEPHLLHIITEFRDQIIEAKKKVVGHAPIHKDDFQKILKILKTRYNLPVDETDMDEMQTFLDPNNDGEIQHHELIHRLAYGHRVLEHMKQSARPSSRNGQIRPKWNSFNRLIDERGGRPLGAGETSKPSPRTRRLHTARAMFSPRHYDGSKSPRAVNNIHPNNTPVPTNRNFYSSWSFNGNGGGSSARPWSAATIARNQFLKQREETARMRETPDMTGNYGRLYMQY